MKNEDVARELVRIAKKLMGEDVEASRSRVALSPMRKRMVNGLTDADNAMTNLIKEAREDGDYTTAKIWEKYQKEFKKLQIKLNNGPGQY